ncbi:peptidylprolyl isomerase [Sphingomonas qomolangmaensis]|uniref:peptidylprolyl isomerase n=1 Tax=Sphingomonas qomolangmaensis TaxID=2918765 RepID=UPI003873B27A
MLSLAILALATPAAAQEPAKVRVRLETSAGPILIAVDTKRAPATAKNFLAYVDDGRFDGVTFYRAARSKRTPGTGFVQGGIRTDARRILPPFPLEPTSKTGIRHLDATISMARGATPEAAGGNFFITVGPAPSMDARPGYPGYAAFGSVIGGMAAVKRILAVKTGGGFDAFRGQMILKPIRITRAVRLDGVKRPTKLPRMWLTGPKRAP